MNSYSLQDTVGEHSSSSVCLVLQTSSCPYSSCNRHTQCAGRPRSVCTARVYVSEPRWRKKASQVEVLAQTLSLNRELVADIDETQAVGAEADTMTAVDKAHS